MCDLTGVATVGVPLSGAEGAVPSGASSRRSDRLTRGSFLLRKTCSSGAGSLCSSTDTGSLGEASPFTDEVSARPHGVSWASGDRQDGLAAHGGAGRGIRLEAAAAQIAHPEKVAFGGEDAWFLCARGSAVGVADGVSEWGRRFGLNPRHFAEEVMEGACAAVDVAHPPGGGLASAAERAASALAAGYGAARSFGAATALVLVLDPGAGSVGVCNLGDCGARLLRRSPDTGRMGVVARTTEQSHEFGKPFQLALIPRPVDFARLRAEGRGALVQAVKQSRAVREDTPADADTFTWSVRSGDLLIVASDGLFDNLFESEMCELLLDGHHVAQRPSADGRGVSASLEDPLRLADRLAQAAAAKSTDPGALTPFADNARLVGVDHVGGVTDDITVVVAWVV